MKDEDKTKEQLIAELVAMRQKNADLEESNRRHKTAWELSLEIDEKWKEGQFTLNKGYWMWNRARDQVVLRPDPSSQLNPSDQCLQVGGEQLDCQLTGTWEEIVDPKAFGSFMKQLESFLTDPKPSASLLFPTRSGAWLLLGRPKPNESSDGTEVKLRGDYLDGTSFMTMVDNIYRIMPDTSDMALKSALHDRILLILSKEMLIEQKELELANRRLISERELRLHEKRMEEMRRILVVSLHGLLEVLRPSDAPLFVTDADMKFSYVSPAMTNWLGLHQSDVIGKTELEVFGAQSEPSLEKTFEVSRDTYTLRMSCLVGKNADKAHGRAVMISFTSAKTTLGVLVDPSWKQTCESQASRHRVESGAMEKTRKEARTVAKKNVLVLLTGESGAGKDHMARYIHDHSNRSEKPYFVLNCAAVSAELAESELFGHEQGAFTGAHGRKRGLLELAESGTFLLNEIGDLSLPLQAKLLTFLDTRKFTRVGGEKEITVNARLIAATNRDLEKEVEEGRFRKDLFYRLKVVQIRVPPLRDCPEEIPILIKTFLDSLATEMELRDSPKLDPSDVEKMKQYDWPGNAREIRNVLEAALAQSDGSEITIDLPKSRSKQETERKEVHKTKDESQRRATAARLKKPTPQQLSRIYSECIEARGYTRADVAKVFGREDSSTVSKWFSKKAGFEPGDEGRRPGGNRDLEALRSMIEEIMK